MFWFRSFKNKLKQHKTTRIQINKYKVNKHNKQCCAAKWTVFQIKKMAALLKKKKQYTSNLYYWGGACVCKMSV